MGCMAAPIRSILAGFRRPKRATLIFLAELQQRWDRRFSTFRLTLFRGDVLTQQDLGAFHPGF